MRIKQELKLPKTPHNLWIDNKAIQELQDFFPVEEDRSNSPETCSHRHQQGWQHLQDLPVQNSLNNNNTISITTNNNNNNINNNPDEVVILASSSPHPIDGSSCEEDDVEDFQSHHSHEDDDDDDDDDSDETSSCDEDDSSISFSDTSPLLDVSSLDEDSSTSSEDSEDDDNDTDMCDEDEGIPESGDVDDNVDDGFEEEEDHGCSMDTSWMSISSAASVDLPSAPETRSQIFDHRRDRNGIVLPDVLPVSVSKASNEDFTPDGVKKIVDATLRELTLRVKKRSDLKLDPVPRLLSRDCCIVEITTQPDIQVDIRLNSAPSAPGIMPISEAYVRHGGTYPPRSIAPPDPVIKNYNSSNKTISEDSTTESQALLSDSTQESRTAARYVGLGEGIRLNNFSIVNGFKAVSLTELVKTDDDESIPPGSPRKIEMTNHASSQESSSSHSVKIEEVSNSPILPEKFPNHPAGGFNIYSKENRRHYKDYTSLQQRPCLDLSKPRSTVSSQDSKSGAVDSFLKNSEIVSNQCINANVLHSQSKKAPQITKKNDVSAQLPKETDEKLSSPELFEVYTLETAVPHVNWTAINRINRESEWLKKRRNDREEIRRKLAMDSDNEDYVAEKLVQSQENGTIDRLKGGNNLQICFMNEAAKATETIVEAEPPVESIEPSTEKVRKPLPKILMPNLLFPPSLQRSPGSSKPQNNNNTQTQVVKRQRPTFFFNRPRSWHAAKVEEKQDPEEDLFTRHHRLQAEAREALTQAKDMARMQMEIERQKKKKSPIADIVGISFPDGQNSLSRHALLDMNVAQLQVIVNDLHSQIETLNENLVKFLLERDDLHMEQDSMLVDIEDLTRYLGLKGGSSVSHSMDSKLPLNVQVSSNNKKSLI